MPRSFRSTRVRGADCTSMCVMVVHGHFVNGGPVLMTSCNVTKSQQDSHYTTDRTAHKSQPITLQHPSSQKNNPSKEQQQQQQVHRIVATRVDYPYKYEFVVSSLLSPPLDNNTDGSATTTICCCFFVGLWYAHHHNHHNPSSILES